MPNGYDKNWRRLCATIDGFYVTHGKWPSRILLYPEVIENLRAEVFSRESFSTLEERLELMPSESHMIAQDDEGNQYSYGNQGSPDTQPSPSAEEWLGLQPDGSATQIPQKTSFFSRILPEPNDTKTTILRWGCGLISSLFLLFLAAIPAGFIQPGFLTNLNPGPDNVYTNFNSLRSQPDGSIWELYNRNCNIELFWGALNIEPIDPNRNESTYCVLSAQLSQIPAQNFEKLTYIQADIKPSRKKPNDDYANVGYDNGYVAYTSSPRVIETEETELPGYSIACGIVWYEKEEDEKFVAFSWAGKYTSGQTIPDDIGGSQILEIDIKQSEFNSVLLMSRHGDSTSYEDLFQCSINGQIFGMPFNDSAGKKEDIENLKDQIFRPQIEADFELNSPAKFIFDNVVFDYKE